MVALESKHQLAVAGTLVLAMAATRFHHLGSTVSLPDASLAVFFLAGLYLRSVWFFAGFVVQAALIDYAALAGAAGDWCISPAYPFLLPTYASLWFAGRWYARRHRADWRTVLPFAGALCVGVVTAFLISNGSFFVFSGYFDNTGWTGYLAGVVEYLPSYAATAVVYVALALGLHVAVIALRDAIQRTSRRALSSCR